jgi:hypothetical protein
MKEKLWPSIARMIHAQKLSTQTLIENIHKRICDSFVTQIIIQNTNEISINEAVALWHPIESNDMKSCEECNQRNIQSYNNLMETLNSLLIGDTLQVLFFLI